MSLQFLEVAGHAINPKVCSVCPPLHKDAVSAQHLQRRGSFLKVRDHLGLVFLDKGYFCQNSRLSTESIHLRYF